MQKPASKGNSPLKAVGKARKPRASSARGHSDLSVPRKAVTISEVARRVGMSASMIRAWERMGMVRPFRADSSYRFYTEDDITALQRAVYLRRYRGLNAPAILEQLREEGYLANGSPKGSADGNSVGPMLRRLRIQRGDSLRTVADKTGVSLGFLSNLERSQVSASVSTMQKLARYYGLNILDFFDRAENPHPHVRIADRKILSGGPGVRMELLAWGPIVMEPHIFSIEPGAHSGEPYAHEGQEFIYVMSGNFTLNLEDQVFALSVGDSLYFESNRAHSFANPGKKEAKVLWINTPPTF
jgi:transcriptional regulator with XRE-family HTH domain